MELINQILPNEFVHALGWTVLHSLWQAFAVALLLAAYLLAWQKTDARKRYIAGNLAMATTLLLAIGTFLYYLSQSGLQKELASAFYANDGMEPGHYFTADNQLFFREYFDKNIPLIVAIWLIGMVFFVLKMFGGLLYIQRLKTRMTAELPKAWQDKMHQLSIELDIRRPVRLLESVLVKAPIVVGWLKPVILLPVGAVNYLTPAQVEAILAHELAHIARHDYLLNLLQSFMETLFYFNPAVWWMSAQVCTERENCCDDIAVRLCGNSFAYAKALVSLQEMQLAGPAFAMSFSKNKNQLLLRIQRILQPSQNKSNVMEKLSATILLTVAVVLLSMQANTPFGNLISRVASKALPMSKATAPVSNDSYFVHEDTIPSGTRDAHIHFNNEDEDIEIRMKDDKIIMLKVGGKEIPASQYGEYEDRIQELLANVPEPPEAPEAPMAPEAPKAPAPPSPPGFHEFATPPTPPAPPAPPRTRTITTKKDGSGTTFIIESQDGSDPVEIKVKDGKKGTIIVNGQEITGLKKGDKTIIMQDLPGGYSYWDGEFPMDDFKFDFSEIAEAPHFDRHHDFRFEYSPEMDPAEYEAMRKAFSKDKLRMMAEAERAAVESGNWREMMERQRAQMHEQMAQLREEHQRMMEMNHEEIERAMERARKAQHEAMELARERSMEALHNQKQLELERRLIEKEAQKELKEKEKEKMKSKEKSKGSM